MNCPSPLFFFSSRGEFGIILHPRVWRKGYCGEAYDLVAHFAFMELRLHRLCSETRFFFVLFCLFYFFFVYFLEN